MVEHYIKNKREYMQAFTLVELLVVLGLFSGLATLSLGSLFNAQSVNGKLQQTQSILDNINLSIQMMTRDIRYGTDFHCSSLVPLATTSDMLLRKNCPYGIDGGVGGSVVFFRPADAYDDSERVAYYLKNGVLYKKTYEYTGTTSVMQITSDDVTITNLLFYVDGANTADGSEDVASSTDYKQPLVNVLLSGSTRPTGRVATSTPFSLQVTISAHDLDNK